MRKGKSRSIFITLCLLPAVTLFFILMIIPTVNVFRMSLFKWGGFSNTKTFVGFDNFRTLLADESFYRAMQNTVFLTVTVTLVTMVFALLFAAILTRNNIPGSGILRVIFYIPNILSVVVISAVFAAIYDPKNGLINSILGFFLKKESPVLWLGDSKIVIYSIAGALIWQAIGYYMVMYMASMASVPGSLYESAELEGAGKIRQFFDITLPLIWTNIRTTLTFYLISSINLSFLLVKALTGGGPDGATEVILTYMYKQAYTNSSYGYGMAIGVIAFLFSFAVSALINRATKREPLEF